MAEALPDRAAYDLQAGAVDIRPLRFTDVLDGAFVLYRSTIRTVVPLVLLVMVPIQLLSAYLRREALSFGFTGLLDDPATGALLMGEGGGSPALVLTLVVQLVVAPVLGGALVLVAGRAYLGQRIGVREAVLGVLPRAGWLVAAYVAGVVVRLSPLLPVVLLAVLGAGIGAVLLGLPAGLLVLLLSPLFVVVAPALVLEDRRPVEAVVHAVRLVVRGYLRTVAVVVGVGVVVNVVALLIAGIPSVIGFIGGFGFAWVLVGLGSVLSQLVAAPLTAAAMVLLHADLRIRQEGMDFDLVVPRLRAPAVT